MDPRWVAGVVWRDSAPALYSTSLSGTVLAAHTPVSTRRPCTAEAALSMHVYCSGGADTPHATPGARNASDPWHGREGCGVHGRLRCCGGHVQLQGGHSAGAHQDAAVAACLLQLHQQARLEEAAAAGGRGAAPVVLRRHPPPPPSAHEKPCRDGRHDHHRNQRSDCRDQPCGEAPATATPAAAPANPPPEYCLPDDLLHTAPAASPAGTRSDALRPQPPGPPPPARWLRCWGCQGRIAGGPNA